MVFQYEVMSLGGKPDGVCFLDTLVWRGFRHVVYTRFMVPFWRRLIMYTFLVSF